MTLDDLLIDKRIVRRNLEKGRLEPTAYQRILDELPDRSGNLWRPDTSSASEPRAVAPAPAPAPAPAAAPAAEEPRAEPNASSPFSPMAPG
jgi:hypothetical protein